MEFGEQPMPSPLGRVPPKGAGEVRISVLLIPCSEYVLRHHLFHRKRSPFPKGEGMGAPAPNCNLQIRPAVDFPPVTG